MAPIARIGGGSGTPGGPGGPGGYAVSTEDTHPWLNTPIKHSSGPLGTTVRKKTKASAARAVTHPIFAECALLTEDPFWVHLFTQASLGKFPRKFSYRDGILSHKRGTRIQTLEVPQVAPEAFSAVVTFLRRYGGIVSERDQEATRLEQYLRSEASQSQQEDMKWSGLSKKVRTVLLDLYINETRRRLQLTKSETLKLRYIVNVGIILGSFNKDNIILDENTVRSIGGLVFHDGEPGQRDFSIDPKCTSGGGSRPSRGTSRGRAPVGVSSLPPDSKVKEDDISYLKDWVKLLEVFDKKVAARKTQEPILRIVVAPGRVGGVGALGAPSVATTEVVSHGPSETRRTLPETVEPGTSDT